MTGTLPRATSRQFATDGLGLVPWRGVIAVEGKPTGDGRMFRRGSLYWDEMRLPQDLFAMLKDPDGGDGHAGAAICGRIDRIWKEEASDHVEVWAEGIYDTSSDTGREVLRLQNQGMLTGVSVDVDAVEVVVPEMSDEDMLMAVLFGGGVEEYSSGRIRRVTVCSIPAFIEARIFPVDTGGTLVAGAGAAGFVGVRVWTPVEVHGGTLVASAAVAAPVERDVFRSALTESAPPADVFTRREYRGYTPYTVDADGRVSGHVSPWGACHIGFTDRCVTAPRSSNGYAHARTGHVLTAEGDLVPTARVFAQFGPGRRAHAPEELAAAPAVEWYESMCLAVADVAVYEDQHGIQVQGRVRPGVTNNQLVAFRASRVSPDWRTISGRLECVGFAVVNVSGFTNTAYPALVASAVGVGLPPRGELSGSMFFSGDECRTLVATGGPSTDVLSDAVASLLARVDELEQEKFREKAQALLAGVPSVEDEQAAFQAEVASLLDGVDLAADDADTADDGILLDGLTADELTVLARVARLAEARLARTAAAELADGADGDTKTCPQCKKQVPADAETCPECGWKLGGGDKGDDGDKPKGRPFVSASDVHACACEDACVCEAVS